jgi:hypothetical protein
MWNIKQKIFLISLFSVIINQICAIDNNKAKESLRFLGGNEVNLICEFPFTCGNGYITNKRICNDISNTLRKRNVNVIEKLVPKSLSINKRDETKDEFFNIYVSVNSKKFLIATTDIESKFFNKNLVNYPKKFISGFGVPNDKDFSQKFELIESIENGILNNK